MDADFFVGEVFLLHFLNGFHPQTLTFFLTIMLILGKHEIFGQRSTEVGVSYSRWS